MILQRSDKESVITCTGSTSKTFGKTVQLCSTKIGIHRFYSIYMSNPTVEDEAQLTNFLKSTKGTVVIVGDLNLKNLDWHSIPTGTRGSNNRWLTLQQERDLTQLVQAPTHLADGIIDIILTNSTHISDVRVNQRQVANSDHLPVTFKVSLPFRHAQCITKTYKNYHNFNIGRWTETFTRSGTTERILNESSPTKAYDLLVNEINRVDRLVLPNVNIRSDGKLPWNSRQIRTQKKSVEWLYQRSKRSNNPQ